MTTSAYMPDVVVEVAFNAGYATPAADRVWTDVSAYVEARSNITITRGRGDERAQIDPSRLTLTLDNSDGRFTPENTAGAYYPNVKKGRPIRVRATHDSVTYDRFLGFVDEWPVAWPDGVGNYSSVTVTAASRSARLARGAELRSIVEEEFLLDDPDFYFPLGEPEGATTAGSVATSTEKVSRLSIKQAGTGGTLAFGAGTGPGTDGLTAPVFTRASAGNGKYLEAATNDLTTIGSEWPTHIEIGAFFNTSTAAVQTLACLYLEENNYILLGINAAGRLHATASSTPGGGAASSATATSATSVADGATHFGVVKVSLNHTTFEATVTVVTDGVAVSAAPIPWTYLYTLGAWFLDFTRLTFGGPAIGALGGIFNGTLAHAVGWVHGATVGADTPVARFGELYDAGATGFAGEAPEDRITRYATYADIPTTDLNLETGLTAGGIAHADTTGAVPIALMQDVAATEGGLLFDGRNGSLTFHARDHRYSTTPAFTLDATTQQVGAALTPKLDDQGMVNDCTASNPDGASVRAVDTTSVAEYGAYRETLELLVTTEAEVESAANWRVSRFGEPRVTIPNLPVDVLNLSTALITQILTAELGDRFTLTNLPTQAPATSIDYFIEGYIETIGAESYDIVFNTSPAAYSDVWQLDSTTYSVLDTSTILGY